MLTTAKCSEAKQHDQGWFSGWFLSLDEKLGRVLFVETLQLCYKVPSAGKLIKKNLKTVNSFVVSFQPFLSSLSHRSELSHHSKKELN